MEVRATTAEEFERFMRAVAAGFHSEASDEEVAHFRTLSEPERTLACLDEGRMVGTAAVLSRTLTVPGGQLPCAAVTGVTVAPTHRRRGLLTAMMRRQLDDVRDRGEPVAALWASEGGIYSRFGYGAAAPHAVLRASRPPVRLASAPALEPPLRSGPAAKHLDAMRAIYERAVRARAGMLTRPGPWWDARLFDPERERDGAQPLRAVVADDGYALYAVRAKWDDDGPAGEVVLRELVATTVEARAAIWGFLLDLDLTRSIEWELAPVDEPLWLMVSDPRAVTMRVWDGLWVRLVDVPAALGARTYAEPPDVVLEVADPFCDWVAGRYRVTGEGCERTEAEPHLALDAGALGAAYLGGTSLLALAAAGRVRELRRGALERAARAFTVAPAPWCGEQF